MVIIDRILNLFQHKAAKDSPVVVLQPKPADDKPVIKYEDRIITEYNINAYRSGRLTFVGGDYMYPNKFITVYRYSIDESLQLDPDDQIYQDVKFMQETENKTIAHEFKHMDNGKFGDPVWIVENYYEMTGLHAFDEVSAYAAECINSNKPNHKEVCCAVSKGIDDLLERKSIYVPRHVNHVGELIGFKFMAGNMESTLTQNWEKPQHYSKKFNFIAGEYLTFNGQGIRDENNVIPAELKGKLRELRHVYEDATSQTLQMIAEKIGRGQK